MAHKLKAITRRRRRALPKPCPNITALLRQFQRDLAGHVKDCSRCNRDAVNAAAQNALERAIYSGDILLRH